MRLKACNVVPYFKKIGLEDTCTGGGCMGWYYKRDNYTYYITVMSELTLPTKYGQHISIGVYDSEFEHQFMSYDIKKFVPSKMMLYINMIEKRMKSKAIRSEIEKNPDQIIIYRKAKCEE